MRQLAQQTNRVAEQNILIVRQPVLPRRWVERGEEFVLGENAGIGQRVHQRALAGVGIADNGDARPMHLLPATAFDTSILADFFELVL